MGRPLADWLDFDAFAARERALAALESWYALDRVRAGVPAREALWDHTGLGRRLGESGEGDGPETPSGLSAWASEALESLTYDLERLAAADLCRPGGLVKAELTLTRRALGFLELAFEARWRSPSTGEWTHGCLALEAPGTWDPDPRAVFFHIGNPLAPDSILARPDYLRDSLARASTTALDLAGPEAFLVTETWLLDEPRFLAAIAPEAIRDIGPALEGPVWHMGRWGQFLRADGGFHHRRGEELRRTGVFPRASRRGSFDARFLAKAAEMGRRDPKPDPEGGRKPSDRASPDLPRGSPPSPTTLAASETTLAAAPAPDPLPPDLADLLGRLRAGGALHRFPQGLVFAEPPAPAPQDTASPDTAPATLADAPPSPATLATAPAPVDADPQPAPFWALRLLPRGRGLADLSLHRLIPAPGGLRASPPRARWTLAASQAAAILPEAPPFDSGTFLMFPDIAWAWLQGAWRHYRIDHRARNRRHYEEAELLEAAILDPAYVEHYLVENRFREWFVTDRWDPELWLRAVWEGMIPISIPQDEGPWLAAQLQQSYAVLDWEHLRLPRKLRRAREAGTLAPNLFLEIHPRLDEVISAIQARHGTNWLCEPYRRLVQEVQKASPPGFAFVAVELVSQSGSRREVLGGELGYRCGGIYTSLSGFVNPGLSPDLPWGLVQICTLARVLQSQGLAFMNLGHPHMAYKTSLGAVVTERRPFLQRWTGARGSLDQEGPSLHGSWNLATLWTPTDHEA